MITTYSMERKTAVSSVTALQNAFILEYMNNAPDGYVKVYLFALMQYQNQTFANDDITIALSMSDEEVMAAFEYWQRYGLLTVMRNDPLHIEFNFANSDAQYRGNTKFSKLLDMLRPILGTRILSATELKKVYDWVEILGISEEAAVILIHHCIKTKGARTSIKYMDIVAQQWADNAIFTEQDAKAYIEKHTAYHAGAKKVLDIWNIGRNPTDYEAELFKKWVTEYQFSEEVILEACNEMTGATNPSFAYLSSIIEEYRDKGAITGETLAQYRKNRMLLEDFCAQLHKTAGISTKPTAAQKAKVQMWLEQYRMPKDVLMLLAKYAAAKARPFDFMSKRVADWNNRDIRNYKDAEADLMLFGSSNSGAHATVPGFKQRKYTVEDLKKLGIDFGD